MVKTLLPCLWAFLACAAFSLVFELRRWRFILAASFTGAVAWLVYLLLDRWGSVTQFLMATVAAAVLSELFARIFKTPATIFLIVAILPMVPGGGIYYTLEALINGDMQLFVRQGMETAAAAGAIAVGCSLVSSVARIITLLRQQRQKKP
jgi:uncharacterized membrane protein YjjB (DUF3815 family)